MSVEALLDEWDALAERQEGRVGRALALLEAAEGARPETKRSPSARCSGEATSSGP